MRNFRSSLDSAGYNQEEAYFFKREQELIEKSRAMAKASKEKVAHLRLQKDDVVEETVTPILPRSKAA